MSPPVLCYSAESLVISGVLLLRIFGVGVGVSLFLPEWCVLKLIGASDFLVSG